MAKETEINGYELSRDWFNFCFENTDIINPNHSALYFFCIEHCNRMGWKQKFGLPMEIAKDAIGIKNYRTYANTFNDLVSWGFIKIIQKSKNQYSANVIALVRNAKAQSKALSKAMQKHSQKQYTGIVGIVKPINLITKEPINIGFSENIESTDGREEYFDISPLQKKINEWVIYRKQMKKPLRQMSKDKLPTELMSLAKGNEETAMKIIDRSIVNGWQGLFALKEDVRQTSKAEENYISGEKAKAILAARHGTN